MSRRTPPASRRQRDPERTKQAILDAARGEFADKGFAGARVDQIAQRAGVNKQLISYYFGGKEGLYRELSSGWMAAEADAMPTYEQMSLADLNARYIENTQREMARLFVWDCMDTGPDPAGEARTERMRHALEDLRRRRDAGELPDDLDPRGFLLTLMAAANAPAAMPRLVKSIFGPDIDPDSPEFLRWYAEEVGRLITHLGDSDQGRPSTSDSD